MCVFKFKQLICQVGEDPSIPQTFYGNRATTGLKASEQQKANKTRLESKLQTSILVFLECLFKF